MKEAINQNEQIIDKSLDRTKDYLSNIEKIFGKHLKEDDKGNYDGDLETSPSKGDQTEIERYLSEDFGVLKNKLENHKGKLTKQTLVTTLLHEMLKEKGIEYKNISNKIDNEDTTSLFTDLNKEQADFTKDIAEIGKGLDSAYENGAVEISYTKKQVETANYNYNLAVAMGLEDGKYLNKADTSMNIMKKYESSSQTEKLETKFVSDNINNVEKALVKYTDSIKNKKDKSIIEQNKKEYENVVILNSDLSYKYNLGEENLKAYDELIDSYRQDPALIEIAMISGIAPLAMMVTPVIKKAIPVLPLVIGAGIYSRFVHVMNSDKFSTMEKTGEIGKIISYTVASIAPFTGTAVAGYETKEAWDKRQNGDINGSAGDFYANAAGTVVSAVFDGVTVFLVATGIGAPAGAAVQVGKVGAKEATKTGIKKLFSYFTKEGFKHHVGSKVKHIGDMYTHVGGKEFAKKTIQQFGKETVEGMWNIMTFKSFREMKYFKSSINKPFEWGANILQPHKVNTFKYLEKKGLVPKEAVNRMEAAGKMAELRMIQNDTLGHYRDDTETIKIEELSKIKNSLSNQNIGLLQQKLETITLENKVNQKEIQEVLNILVLKDQHMGISMNIGLHLLNDINELNSLEGTKKTEYIKKIIKNIDNELILYKGKVTDNLVQYIESVKTKLKKGESFGDNTGNYLLLINKFHGKAGVEQLKPSDKQIEEYKKLLGGKNESQMGYAGNYFQNLNTLKNIIENKDVSSKNKKIVIKSYIKILQKAEATGFGTTRLEYLMPELIDKIDNGEINNGYEYYVNNILNNINLYTDKKDLKKFNDKELMELAQTRKVILENLDLSIIYNKEAIETIIDKTFLDIKNTFNPKLNGGKPNYKGAINIIKKVSNSGNEEAIKELKIKLLNNTDFVNELLKTNSNRDLLVLLNYVKIQGKEGKRVLGTKTEIYGRILDNLKNNTQLKLNGEGTIGKLELNRLLEDIQVLPDDKKLEAYNTIILKLSGDPSNNPPSDEQILIFIKQIESYKVAADFASFKNHEVFGKYSQKITDSIIEGKYLTKEGQGDYASIEYKLKYIESLTDKDLQKATYIQLKKQLLNTLNKDNLSEYFIKKIDRIQYLIDSKKIKGKDIHKLISEGKESKLYKERSLVTNLKTLELLDSGRNFTRYELKELKAKGEITSNTLYHIDKVLKTGIITNPINGDIIGKLTPIAKQKLENLRLKVKNALSEYQINFFNKQDFDKFTTTQEKGKYIYKIIDGITNGKLSTGGKANKEITAQLANLKHNMGVDSKSVDYFIYYILSKTQPKDFNVKEKIDLLNLLERAKVIHPSVEQKLEYMINIASDSEDMRENTHLLKEYSKNFDKGILKGNEEIQRLKEEGDIEGIRDYVIKTKSERITVDKEYVDKRDLKEGIDYVKLDDGIYITEIFPARYFLNQMIKTKDQHLKEMYMELIADKNLFGDKSFKEYFNDKNIDIKTKILMSYHDSIKYDPDVIELLKESSKDPELSGDIAYALKKRGDFDILSGKENIKIGLLERELNNGNLGEGLSNVEKNAIIELFKVIENMKITDLTSSIRGLDNDSRINEQQSNFLIKNESLILKIQEKISQNIGIIEQITRDGSIKDIIASIRLESEKDDKKKLNVKIDTFVKNIKNSMKNHTTRGIIRGIMLEGKEGTISESLSKNINIIEHELLTNQDLHKLIDNKEQFKLKVEKIISNISPDILKEMKTNGTFDTIKLKIFSVLSVGTTVKAASFSDNFKSKDWKLLQNQFSLMQNKLFNLPTEVKADSIRFEKEIDKLLPQYSELDTVKDRDLLNKQLFDQINFTPSQLEARTKIQKSLDLLNDNKLMTLIIGSTSVKLLINEVIEYMNKNNINDINDRDKMGELHAKALQLKLDNLKLEIYEQAKKLVHDDAKAKILAENIFDYLKDFKSEKNEVKYLGRIDGLSVENQKNLLNRYNATVSIINPTNIQEADLTKSLQKSLDNNVYHIYKFYNEVEKGRGKAESTATKHEKKVPELQGTEIMEIERKEGQIADIKYKIKESIIQLKENGHNKEANRVENRLKELDKNIEMHDKNIEMHDKNIKERNNILGTIKK